jgi:glycosyltransferase involved in cell wall biosynthesis
VLPKPDRKYFTYAGSGAPWQNLESLNLLWKEISKINPDQQFMVISRDPRSRSLGDGLPKEKVRFESVVGPEPVGELLQEAQLGFATRQPSLINQVSYPTKIGEYLAAGVPVVTSDIDWDPGDLLRDESVGLLLSPGVSEEAAAKDVQEFYEQTSGNSERTADACASIASKISYDTLLADLTNQFSRLSSKA